MGMVLIWKHDLINWPVQTVMCTELRDFVEKLIIINYSARPYQSTDDFVAIVTPFYDAIIELRTLGRL